MSQVVDLMEALKASLDGKTYASQRERPLLMSGPMVRAILDGRKTQTRRVMKPTKWAPWHRAESAYRADRWTFGAHPGGGFWGIDSPNADLSTFPPGSDTGFPCPYGTVGDLLWVRETWACIRRDGYAIYPTEVAINREVLFRASDDDGLTEQRFPWRPSIHMPRWASRLTLRVTDVRVERLAEISWEDSVAEGIERSDDPGVSNWPWLGALHPIKGTPKVFPTPKLAFASRWDALNAKRGHGWDTNPWVWAITFERAA